MAVGHALSSATRCRCGARGRGRRTGAVLPDLHLQCARACEQVASGPAMLACMMAPRPRRGKDGRWGMGSAMEGGVDIEQAYTCHIIAVRGGMAGDGRGQYSTVREGRPDMRTYGGDDDDASSPRPLRLFRHLHRTASACRSSPPTAHGCVSQRTCRVSWSRVASASCWSVVSLRVVSAGRSWL
jgi:hypothetical protein